MGVYLRSTFPVRAFLLVLAACAAEPGPDVVILPDAAEVEIDACVREPSGDCCALLPDEDAVRSCVARGATNGECGVAVCWTSTCELIRISFCGATD